MAGDRDAAGPRWLSPDERAAWLSVGRLLTRLPSALDAQLQTDSGLSFVEYMVLAVLSEQPDRSMRMSELAALADSSLSRLSHLARRMEAEGLLTRCPDVSDGRYTLAVLTDAGWEKVVAAAPGHVAAVRSLVVDQLTPAQLEQLRSLNEQILAVVDPGNPWLAGSPGRTCP